LKSPNVTVIDYGLGNVHAFVNIYKRLNISVQVASRITDLEDAERLILPGVGSFDWAMTRLNHSGLREALDNLVLNQQLPVLGVCVGMQMMASRSEEGALPGLGWIDAEVMHFDQDRGGPRQPLPHMGWNDVRTDASECLFKGIEAPRYYFLHSYCIEPRWPADVLATACYGREFTAAVRHGNVLGTQFHPEKSHQWGIALLRNFAEL